MWVYLKIELQQDAHAAQLVALREEAWALADGEGIVGHTDDCTCDVCGTAQSIAAAIRALPIPNAEAALARVREEERQRCVKAACCYCRAGIPYSDEYHAHVNCMPCGARAIRDALGGSYEQL